MRTLQLLRSHRCEKERCIACYILLRNQVFLKGLVRSMRIFFLMPPDEEDEAPLVQNGVRYGMAIAVGALLAFAQKFLLDGKGFWG